MHLTNLYWNQEWQNGFGFAAGFLDVTDWFKDDVSRVEFRVLVDLTLALILFIDAANADISVLRRQIKIPSRMLLVGLPGVIALQTEEYGDTLF